MTCEALQSLLSEAQPLVCCGGHYVWVPRDDGPSQGFLASQHELWCVLDLSAPLT